jgi:hypothetical protein
VTHGQAVPSIVAAILDIAHDLAHEVNAEAAGPALFQRRGDIDGWVPCGIEGLSTVAEFHFDVAGPAQPHARRLVYSFATAVPNGIHKQLFQHQIEIKGDVFVQGMGGAKAADLAGQAIELAQISVQEKIGFVQNGMIVPHEAREFQRESAGLRGAGTAQAAIIAAAAGAYAMPTEKPPIKTKAHRTIAPTMLVVRRGNSSGIPATSTGNANTISAHGPLRAINSPEW